jgi:hypothetical protein
MVEMVRPGFKMENLTADAVNSTWTRQNTASSSAAGKWSSALALPEATHE